MDSYSISDARAQLPNIINKVEEGQPTQLTRRGKPVAVVLSVDEYHLLLATSGGGILKALSSYKVICEDTEVELSDEVVDSWRDRDSGRSSIWE